jgi:hypothetical protein
MLTEASAKPSNVAARTLGTFQSSTSTVAKGLSQGAAAAMDRRVPE